MSSNWAEPKLLLGDLPTSNSVHHRQQSDLEPSPEDEELDSVFEAANIDTNPQPSKPYRPPRVSRSKVENPKTPSGAHRASFSKDTKPPSPKTVANKPKTQYLAGPTSPEAPSPQLGGNRLTSVKIEGDNAKIQQNSRIRIAAGQLLPGTRYRILRWIGEGNMGVVYEAEHVDIERQVALKVLNADFSRIPAVAQVFREEARASARIGAANIVDIVDFAELADGRLMYAMEFIKGRTLHTCLEEGPIDSARLIGILRQVCKGLSAAHQAGIVHRDIKPENIMLCMKDGRSDSVKILDFGISAMLEQKGSVEQLSGIVGTPFYMAPEQILSQAFDGRLDMYALGCTAYELLTGRPPFLDEDLMAILRSHISDPPPPPSTLVATNSIPTALEAVVLRCLSKEPNERFRDMNDLEGALCEAQITSNLSTPWDDLPLPELEADRRDKILSNMPDILYAVKKPGYRKWFIAMTLVATLSGAALILNPLGKSPPAVNEESKQIHELVRSAREAAAKSFFVYPPADNPKLPTAYFQVLQLDRIALDGNQLAKQSGQLLREEFANTLIRLGDDYWEREGGQAFAIDYYAMALVFLPQHRRAKERALYTPGEMAALRHKAEKSSFTETELIAAEPLFVLAQPESEKLAKNLARLQSSGNSRHSLRTRASLEQLLRQAVDDSATLTRNPLTNQTTRANPPVETPPKQANESKIDPEDDLQLLDGDTDTPPRGELVTEQESALERADSTTSTPATSKRTPKNSRRGSSKRTKKVISDRPQNPTLAAKYVAQAKQAHRAGKMAIAESFYHQALAEDSKHLPAMEGLGDTYFDLAKYSKSVQFRRKTVQLAPKNSTYRRLLGDAYFKVLRYADALQQYRKALALGDGQAEARIEKLERLIGAL